MIGFIFNNDKRKRQVDALLEKSKQDVLTNLLNKENARIRIEEHLADRKDSEHSAMLLVDLDNFKYVNDRYGHMFGDAVLCEVASLIRKHFRPDDVVARIGGDEFLVFLKNVTPDLVRKRCTSLLNTIKSRLDNLIREGNVSGSIGAAFVPVHANDYTELFQKADKALYMSKNAGKNTFRIYDSSEAINMNSYEAARRSTDHIDSMKAPALPTAALCVMRSNICMMPRMRRRPSTPCWA